MSTVSSINEYTVEMTTALIGNTYWNEQLYLIQILVTVFIIIE